MLRWFCVVKQHESALSMHNGFSEISTNLCLLFHGLSPYNAIFGDFCAQCHILVFVSGWICGAGEGDSQGVFRNSDGSKTQTPQSGALVVLSCSASEGLARGSQTTLHRPLPPCPHWGCVLLMRWGQRPWGCLAREQAALHRTAAVTYYKGQITCRLHSHIMAIPIPKHILLTDWVWHGQCRC